MSQYETFAQLHQADEAFILPNPWDVGSAKILEAIGFKALATTSSGFAATMGRNDMTITLDELLRHVADIVAAVDIPLNVDSERCYADTVDGVAETVALLGSVGAAGISIEDWDPETGAIDPLAKAVERVAAAADAAHAGPNKMVLTARAENHLHGVDDLDDTIARLVAFRDAGADCLYAPGVSSRKDIQAVVDATGMPLNVLAWPGGLSVDEYGTMGVKRISVGGAFAFAAYGALAGVARDMLQTGKPGYWDEMLSSEDRKAAFG